MAQIHSYLYCCLLRIEKMEAQHIMVVNTGIRKNDYLS